MGVLRSAASIRCGPTSQRRELLEKAWALPVARLCSPLQSQTFTSICGPTSVCNVLRSIGETASANPFRHFGLRAMSLEQIVTESSPLLPADWAVEAVRPRSVEAFRAELRASSDPSRRYVANFTRAALFGGGGGHHSPPGGCLEEEELAFVLDVNSSSGPWLVNAERLFAAVKPETGQAGSRAGWRGSSAAELLHLRRSPRPRAKLPITSQGASFLKCASIFETPMAGPPAPFPFAMAMYCAGSMASGRV